jgi:hypothetical protein
MREVIGILMAALAVAVSATGACAEHVCNIPPTGNRYVALRTGPGHSYPPIERLRHNKHALVVSERTDEWVKVSLKDGPTGWLPAGAVCLGEPQH